MQRSPPCPLHRGLRGSDLEKSRIPALATRARCHAGRAHVAGRGRDEQAFGPRLTRAPAAAVRVVDPRPVRGGGLRAPVHAIIEDRFDRQIRAPAECARRACADVHRGAARRNARLRRPCRSGRGMLRINQLAENGCSAGGRGLAHAPRAATLWPAPHARARAGRSVERQRHDWTLHDASLTIAQQPCAPGCKRLARSPLWFRLVSAVHTCADHRIR